MDKSYDVSSIVDTVKKKFKSEKIHSKVGSGADLRSLEEKDFIKLGPWWTEPTHLYGFPLGRLVTISGPSDSGKTSFCIQVMKAAQEQGVAVIYCETESKTSKEDLMDWGVDPTQVMMISSFVAEELFELLLTTWDSFKDKYPDSPLLVIIDSIGNLLSKRDEELDMMEQNSSPGGKGKANRLGLSKILSRMSRDNAGVLLVSYTYSNIGTVGNKTAGGEALHLYSSLMYQTARLSWVERQEKGKKYRVGANVVFKLQKNHINKRDPGSAKITFRVTKEGMFCLDKKDREDLEEEDLLELE